MDVKLSPTVVVIHVVERFNIDAAKRINDVAYRRGFENNVIVGAHSPKIRERVFDELGSTAHNDRVHFVGDAIRGSDFAIAWNADSSDLRMSEIDAKHHHRVGP